MSDSLSIDPDTETIYSSLLFGHSFQYLQAERVGPRLFFEKSNFNLGSKGEYASHFLTVYGDNDIPNLSLLTSGRMASLMNGIRAWRSC